MRLAMRAERGDGLPRDARRALRLYQKACIVGRVARACERAGAMALEGRGAPPDDVAAFDSFTWGCEDGSAEACVRLGSMQLEGRVPAYRPQAIAARREAAARAFQEACSAGSEEGCSKLADLFEEQR